MPAVAFPIDGQSWILIVLVAVCLALILALFVALMTQRLVWWVVGGYVQRREQLYAEAVLGVLFDIQGLAALRGSARWRRNRLGKRLFDTPILERMLLAQAVELRGTDRATMTEVFEQLGLVDRTIRQTRSLRWWRRLIAVQKLGVMCSARAVPALMHAAADHELNVRLAAQRGLAEIGDESAYPALLAVLEQNATLVRIADIVLAIGPPISPYLLDRFAAVREPRVQAVYARLLGMLHEPDALETLLSLTQAADPQLRLEAIVALGAIGDARAVDVLHTLLHDPDRQLRAEAARALGSVRSQTSVAPLQALLVDSAQPVRYAAACALAALGAEGQAALTQTAEAGTADARGIAEQVLAEQALALI